MNALNILCVEDIPMVAGLMKDLFAHHFSSLSLTVVADAENAAKAVLKERFSHWANPIEDEELTPCEGHSFVAVFWDNEFPATWKGLAQQNMGIQIAASLHRRVDRALAERFAALSASPVEIFAECKCFNVVIPKPATIGSLRSCLRQWKLIEDPPKF